MPDLEEDHVSSTLRWKDVVLPASVTESDVDKLIFAALKENLAQSGDDRWECLSGVQNPFNSP